MELPRVEGVDSYRNSARSEVRSIEPSAKVDPEAVMKTPTWDVNMVHLGIEHGTPQPEGRIDSLKRIKNQIKRAAEEPVRTKTNENRGSSGLQADPVVQENFRGNVFSGFTPPDNHLAVSDDGFLVSVVNSSLYFGDVNGTVFSESSLSSFFSPLNLNGTYFDPRVMYDPIEDKFIMVVLNGSTPSNTHVVIGFSTTSDPRDTWWFYDLDGNPLNNSFWFDFPSTGLSNEELYVSGNLFDANNNFSQVLIYQIDKANGFTGGTINWVYWFDVRDANDVQDFTVVPISFGFDGALSPGIFFVSTQSGGGDKAMLYYTTDTYDNNPQLEVFEVAVADYALSGDGAQAGSSDLIATNDTRTLSGFYADGYIHYVLNTDLSGGVTGLYYARINVDNHTSSASAFGLSGFEYAFPAVAPFSNDPADRTVLIGFTRTGTSIFPEFRVVRCDEDFNWSSSVLVKSGESFVDILLSDTERWGDYSGISKRHGSEIEVWVAGCYGEDFSNGVPNVYGTWIGQVGSNTVQAPAANFSADQTTVFAGEQVHFSDLSANNPTSWSWNFPGGDPASSTTQNPSVTYNSPGTYSVTLSASNSAGNDAETKSDYITVEPVVLPPGADFSASQTVIDAGQQVTFTDESSNTPTGWAWNFPGGDPASSTAQNPSVTYNSPGTYSVTLTATNQAGNDVETKTNYITVNAVTVPPAADFSADQTTVDAGQQVAFTDLSTNNPTNWAWSFPGGTPNTSSQQNPVISYNTPGVYAVSLTSANQAGNDTESKTDYITVESAIQPPEADFSANQTTVVPGEVVVFTDLSANNPTSWTWNFPGGTPASSSEQNPEIVYQTPGIYTVSLTAANSAGDNSEVKANYITVDDALLPPEADFSANQTAIVAGQQVVFMDQSTNNPSSWAWSFPGGNPATSDLQDPIVTYPNPGTYNVSLTSTNAAGTDSETKNGFITVEPAALAPVADFTADQTTVAEGGVVAFSDISANEPESWTWSFPGGTPNTSNLQNPIIVYSTPGIYDVSLVVANAAGNDAVTKSGYITVDRINATAERTDPIDDLLIFPNPLSSTQKVRVRFSIKATAVLHVYLADASGRIVKYLFHDRVKAGQNLLSFNAALLPAGTYFLMIQNDEKQILQSLPLVVVP